MPRFLRRLLPNRPKIRKTADEPGFVVWFQASPAVTALIYALFLAALLALCFAGVSTGGQAFLPNQIATTRVVATTSFDYTSAGHTRIAREQIRDRVPPVYKLNPADDARHRDALRKILDTLPEGSAPSPHDIAAAIAPLNASASTHVNPDDVAILLAPRPETTPARILDNALITLREIQERGIYDPSLFPQLSDNQSALLQVTAPDGRGLTRSAQSLGAALRQLRVNLAAENTDPRLGDALYRLLRPALKPNLAFDFAATKALQDQAAARLRPVVIHVQEGQVIVEPGNPITPEQHEMLLAHSRYVSGRAAGSPVGILPRIQRALLALALVLAAWLGIRIENNGALSTNGRRLHLAALVLLNIAFLRAVCELANLPALSANPVVAAALPWLAPAALAPLLASLLASPRVAVFVALLTSLSASAIFGSRLDLLAVTFLASLVAIASSRDNTRRLKLLRSAFSAGLVLALYALASGLLERLPPAPVLAHIAASLASGLLSGVLAIGLLPLFESLFRRVTDITLIELTDYNHPLLSLMQIEAPGTYHHSLVVAQLAETAAAAIGANPLLARVCALYHDIGKTRKPEYFTENQDGAGKNPHDEANPSLSALIIKAHVKDGVDIAVQHKLPRVVIRAIQRHHGTSLIRYFYHRAREEEQSAAATAPLPGLAPAPTAQATYRYDGPKPDSRECAILHLADQVEAASRSLRQPTPQNLRELIDSVTANSIADGQLDDAPLTIRELSLIKARFAKTLVTMLHSRVAYPADDTKKT